MVVLSTWARTAVLQKRVSPHKQLAKPKDNSETFGGFSKARTTRGFGGKPSRFTIDDFASENRNFNADKPL